MHEEKTSKNFLTSSFLQENVPTLPLFTEGICWKNENTISFVKELQSKSRISREFLMY
jgi:hypothetical protein